MKRFAHPISYGLSSVRLPLIPITLGDYSLCLIVDTGATHSLIDDEIVSVLGDLATRESANNVLIGVNGDKSEANRTATISFSVDNYIFTHTFICEHLIKPFLEIEKESNIQVHGIIGNDFLLANKWIIDYEKLVIHLS